MSFKNTLCVIAQSFTNAQTLRAIHDEFDAALPDLADFRNAMVHGEDWVRGQGGGKRRARRYLGSQTLLSGPTNPNRELCVVSFHHEGDERQKFFYPEQALRATELALAALAGKRQPADPDDSPTTEVD